LKGFLAARGGNALGGPMTTSEAQAVTAIRGRLQRHTRPGDARVDVAVRDDGTVELSGFARDYLIKKEVEQFVRAMKECRRVESRILVDPVECRSCERPGPATL